MFKVILFLGFLLLGFAFIASRTENPLAKDMFPITTSEAATASFDGKLGALATSRLSLDTTRPPAVLHFDEVEVSSKLTNLTRGEYGVGKGAQAHLTGGLRMLIQLSVIGIPVHAGVQATPSVESGRVKLTPTKVFVGSFDLTGQLGGQAGAILDLITTPINTLTLGKVVSVEAEGGFLTIKVAP